MIKRLNPNTGKIESMAFEALNSEEQDVWLDTLDNGALKRLAKMLAETIVQLVSGTIEIEPDEFEELKKRLDEKS